MPDFRVVPMTKTLLVEGRRRREGFRGLVLAVGWRADEDADAHGGAEAAPELHYLVSDESRPSPIWVEARMLTSQRWFPVASAEAVAGAQR